MKKTRLFDELKSAMDEGISAYAKPGALRRSTLDVPPPPAISPDDIRAIRKTHEISQPVLAAILGTSLKALQSWEQGERVPLGPARRILQWLAMSPELGESLIRAVRPQKGARKLAARKGKVRAA